MANELSLRAEGFTNWLSTGSEIENFIQTPGLETTFDIITAGYIPPNPSEILALPQVSEMIQKLKTRYDFTILDTPPIGLVTDARLLSHLADLSLYIVRQDFTYKNQLDIVREIREQNQLRGLHLILNDVRETHGYHYGYGYYQPKKPPLFNVLKRIFKS